MTFEDWFKQLTEIATEEGFLNAGNPANWQEEFSNGLTPQQAWDGSWDLE
ncbi:hypothetical protein ACI2JW_04300 [Serratia ureilytica]